MKKANKKILIIGGAGFIGAHLTKKLIMLRHSVYVFDNLSNVSTIYNPKLGIQIYGDVRNFNKVSECIKKIKPDILINLAAYHYIPNCIKNPQKTIDVNLTGNQNCLKAISKFSPTTIFVLASSAAIYKPSTISHNEKSPIGPIDIYGKSKYKAEKITTKYGKEFKIKYCILRLFNVYGYGNNTPHLIPTIIDQIKNKHTITLGNTHTKRDYIHGDSVVLAFVKIIDNFLKIENETFNIGSGTTYTPIDIVNIIESKISIKNIEYVRKKIIVKKNKKRTNDRPLLASNINKARKKLGWNPIPLSSGIKKLIKEEKLINA